MTDMVFLAEPNNEGVAQSNENLATKMLCGEKRPYSPQICGE